MKSRRSLVKPLALQTVLPTTTTTSSSNNSSSNNNAEDSTRNDKVVASDEEDGARKTIKELEARLAAAEDRARDLDEEVFSLKTELLCKAAEEKHGKSSLIESLESKIAFKQKELDESESALRKERSSHQQTKHALAEERKAARNLKKRLVPIVSPASSSQDRHSPVPRVSEQQPKLKRRKLPRFSPGDMIHLIRVIGDEAQAMVLLGDEQQNCELVLVEEIAKKLRNDSSRTGDADILFDGLRKLNLQQGMTHPIVHRVIVPIVASKELWTKAVVKFLILLARRERRMGLDPVKDICEHLLNHMNKQRTFNQVENDLFELLGLLIGLRPKLGETGLEALVDFLVKLLHDSEQLTSVVHLCLTTHVSYPKLLAQRQEAILNILSKKKFHPKDNHWKQILLDIF